MLLPSAPISSSQGLGLPAARMQTPVCVYWVSPCAFAGATQAAALPHTLLPEHRMKPEITFPYPWQEAAALPLPSLGAGSSLPLLDKWIANSFC